MSAQWIAAGTEPGKCTRKQDHHQSVSTQDIQRHTADVRRGGEGRWMEKHVCEGGKIQPEDLCLCGFYGFVAFMLLKWITAAKLNKMQDKKNEIAAGVC